MSLLVAIHDVAPAHLSAAQRLRAMALECGVGRVSLLAVPNYHGQAHLSASPETARWLRSCVAEGDEVCLHGYEHVQRRSPVFASDRLRAWAATDGEGECLALDALERQRVLCEGRREVENVIGKSVHGFVAPAWLEPAGFGDRLLDAGFAWHESSLWVERLRPKRSLLHRPVIGFATRSLARKAAGLAWAATLGACAVFDVPPVATPVRLALHPDDLGSPAVLALARRLMRSLAKRRPSLTYCEALGIV